MSRLRQLSFLRSPTTILIIAWVVYLIYQSSTPRLLIIPALPRPMVSAAAHLAAHFILASLIFTALARSRPGLLGGLKSALAALAIATLIGAFAEGLQSVLPDRSAQVSDVLFDVAGALSGIAAVAFLRIVRLPTRLIIAAIGSAMALVVVGTTVSTAVWNPAYPYVGDHWHNIYAISVCGVRQPSLPSAPGGVHSHGGELLHVHPRDSSEAGENATLSLVFKSSGGELTKSGMTMPWGASYSNGDLCPDGRTGELAVFVDGVRLEDPTTYVLGNRQTIIIMFRAIETRDQA